MQRDTTQRTPRLDLVRDIVQCPQCGATYDGSYTLCLADGTELVPQSTPRSPVRTVVLVGVVVASFLVGGGVVVATREAKTPGLEPSNPMGAVLPAVEPRVDGAPADDPPTVLDPVPAPAAVPSPGAPAVPARVRPRPVSPEAPVPPPPAAEPEPAEPLTVPTSDLKDPFADP